MNIKAEELRIGNLVADEWFDSFKIIIKIESINDKGINLEITDDGNWSEIAQRFITPEYEFKQLRGIPITEELLLKIGFSKWRDTYLVLYIDEESGFNISYNISSKGIECGYQDEMFHIKHLHQIQNLYFALTGQELNIGSLLQLQNKD